MDEYKLMIADDEIVERRGLERMVRALFPELILLKSVSNGTELLQSIQAEMPDIIITDINMPGLNGLETVEILRLKSVESRIIINTAYSNFEYTQKAVELGAFGYLLKPSDERMLKKVLQRAIDDLKKERAQQKEQNDSQEKLRKMQNSVGRAVMSSILLGQPDENSFQIWAGERKITAAGVLVLLCSNQKMQEMVWLEKLRQRAEGMEKYCANLCHIHQQKLFLYLMPGNEVDEFHYREWTCAFLERLCRDIGGLCLAVSGWKNSLAEMPGAVRECLYQQELNHFEGLTFYEDAAAGRRAWNVSEEDICRIARLIGSGEWAGLQNLFENQVREWADFGCSIQEQYVLLSCLTRQCSASRPNLAVSVGQGLLTAYQVEECSKPEEIAAKCTEALRKSCSIADPSDTRAQYIHDAVRIIKEQFAEDLALEDVSGQLGISPFYLSRLLKRYLDRGFVELLTEIRINASIDLIRQNSELSIRDIGRMAGYPSETYFYKVFKKNTGMTVGRMRALLIGNEK